MHHFLESAGRRAKQRHRGKPGAESHSSCEKAAIGSSFELVHSATPFWAILKFFAVQPRSRSRTLKSGMVVEALREVRISNRYQRRLAESRQESQQKHAGQTRCHSNFPDPDMGLSARERRHDHQVEIEPASRQDNNA